MEVLKKETSISKELINLTTYPFSDPSPVPEFGRLYPYNRFDGYTHEGKPQAWEMIVLENEYIKLWINPAVGGKIWGAVEKASGKEFIYFNHAAKFRDVAMRGPWTSGGMETNMGIIGHTPSCSAPVDYFMRNNADGSASCFISATDWPSRTNWVIEVNLPADTAFFTTKSSWYNGSGLEQAYYQWNNVGIKTQGNLEYIFPGHKRLGHDGKQFSWPKDEQNRQISWYDHNNFGEYKSYHITGSHADFWGCYWHDDDFGLAHYTNYDDKPGKKIWIWGLSRYGMIWEDLLTDSDGQYTEVQSGRLFNQSIAQSSKTPFKHHSFSPHGFDSWAEHWFPVKNLGGLSYACQLLSFYLQQTNDAYHLNICANKPLNGIIKIYSGDTLLLTEEIALSTLQTTSLLINIEPNQLKLWFNDELIYNATEEQYVLQRPVEIAAGYNFDSVQAIYFKAKEWERQRFFERAIEQYKLCLQQDEFFVEALIGLAGIYIKHVNYAEALALLKKALSVDTYNGNANYLYGIANSRLSQLTDAKDGFAIASQCIQYRSAAYTELAKLYIGEGQPNKALHYIEKALQYNMDNCDAWQLKVNAMRLNGNASAALDLLNTLLAKNPLNHFNRFELFKLGAITAAEFQAGITSEMPYETYLEIALFYFTLKEFDTCLSVLALAPAYALVSIWKARVTDLTGNAVLAKKLLDDAALSDPNFVFPHREEDIKTLLWATQSSNAWQFKYYLAIAYMQILRYNDAAALLGSCSNEPDIYTFYLVKAKVLAHCNQDSTTSFEQAYQLAPEQWRTALALSTHLANQNNWRQALKVVKQCFRLNPNNYYLGLHYAKCLLKTKSYAAGIALLNQLRVLPNEGASEGRNVWREIHIYAAIEAIGNDNLQQATHYVNEALKWPENLGVGKPYEVDERLEIFISIYIFQQQKLPVPASLTQYITGYRAAHSDTPYSANDFLSMYLLNILNQANAKQAILSDWLGHNSEDVAAKWTQSFFNNDAKSLAELALIEPKKQIPLPYEILFEDRNFQFIKEMHRQHFF